MTTATRDAILAAYGARSEELTKRYTGLDAETLMAPVRSYFPKPPARVLDIGAGPGRDALWFAEQGYQVTAVDPVPDFVSAGKALTGEAALWRDDVLPELASLDEESFDLIYVMAMWQHLPPGDDASALKRIWNLLAPGGRVTISLRFGPGHPDRPVFKIDLEVTRALAKEVGFSIVADFPVPGLQRDSQVAGTTWRCLILGD